MLRALKAGVVALSFMGCAGVLEIDDIVIDEGAGSTGGSTGTGEGGDGAAATGGSGGASETCTNGMDDNDDGLVDCEDPLCGDFTCVEEPPPGWSGPYASALAASVGSCPASAPTEVLVGGYGELDVPAASCSTCTCDAPAGVSCSVASLTSYDEVMCDQDKGDNVPPMAGQCDELGGNARSVRGNADSVASGGSCMSTGGGEPTSPAATFETEARVCEGELGAGCAGGSLCMPTPEAPFSEKPCILSAGDVACPDGAYTERQVVFAGVDDQRGCTTCGCGAPQSVTCTGTSVVYKNPDCSGTSYVAPHDDTCTETGGEPVRSQIFDVVASGGSCPPQGGEPTGTATPTTPTTICCLP